MTGDNRRIVGAPERNDTMNWEEECRALRQEVRELQEALQAERKLREQLADELAKVTGRR